jgi:hypothetical protein
MRAPTKYKRPVPAAAVRAGQRIKARQGAAISDLTRVSPENVGRARARAGMRASREGGTYGEGRNLSPNSARRRVEARAEAREAFSKKKK